MASTLRAIRPASLFLAAFVLAVAPGPAHSQPLATGPGWTELSPSTVVRSAERVHRIRVRDTTPVDLLYLGVGSTGMSFESLEVTLADGTTQTLEIQRRIGDADHGAFLVLCGGPQVIRSVRVRHAAQDARYDTRVSLRARARTPSTTGALDLPCASHPEAIPSPEPIAGYAWGATMAAVRARCTADGGTVTEPRPNELVCAPFAPLSAASARFDFHAEAPTGLWFVEVARRSVQTASLRDEMRREIAPWLARLGRPLTRAFPEHCDLVFFDTPETCLSVGPINLHYRWAGPLGTVSIDTEQSAAQHAIRVSFTRPG